MIINGSLYKIEWDSILYYDVKACSEVSNMSKKERDKVYNKPLYIIAENFSKAYEAAKKYENKYFTLKALDLDKNFKYSQIEVPDVK